MDPYFFLSQFTLMTINLYEILISCSRENTNSKYFDKMWQLIKYSLLVMT